MQTIKAQTGNCAPFAVSLCEAATELCTCTSMVRRLIKMGKLIGFSFTSDKVFTRVTRESLDEYKRSIVSAAKETVSAVR